MSYFDHIQRCNAHNLSRFVPLSIAGHRLGGVRLDRVAELLAFPDIFERDDRGLALNPRFQAPDDRTRALDSVIGQLAEAGRIKLQGERYGISERWGSPLLATIDRGAVMYLGLPAYGVHLNGFVRQADGLHVWVGKRAQDRAASPGKLDNIVAGGQPAGLSLTQNLIKECAEEAAIPEALARQAHAIGAITYLMETEDGLKPDVMFCFDLELPAGFAPRNTDGEIEGFELWPVKRLAERVRDTDDFKFNVNLVVIDFLIRHGFLHPDNEPDYVRLLSGLRALPHPLWRQ